MNLPLRRRSGSLALVLGLCAGVAGADVPGPASTPAAIPSPATEVAPRPVVVPSTATPTVEPVRPMLPPPAAIDLQQSVTAGLVREGALISQARARVVQGKSGRWYAIFDGTGGTRDLPPMVLLPSASLSSITRAAERATPGTRMRLSGTVTVYRNHNYLVASAPPLVERADAVPATPVTTPGSTSSTTTSSSDSASTAKAAGGEPSIDDIVAELDRSVGSKPELPSVRVQQQQVDVAREGAAAEPASRVMPAGFLAGRKCRVVRAPDGYLMVRFDNGVHGATEPAIALLPCQNTSTLEGIVDSMGEGGTMTVSGHVQVHENKNYLLPTMYVIDKKSEHVMPVQ